MRRILIVLAALTAGAGTGSPAAAQSTAAEGDALSRVVEHIDAARFDSARAQLAAWRDANAASAAPGERARADMLAARLETDGVAAQHAWLSLALEHPFGPDAGLALLRVGQAALLQGDTAAARTYLRRLIDDFPSSGHGADARLWLSRAHLASGNAADACDVAREGLGGAGSSEVRALLRSQEEAACTAATAAAPAGDPVRPSAAALAANGRFAVQSGAFRTRTGADDLVARLRRAGFEPRLVRVPGSELMRVRVGGFDARTGANTLRDRVRAAGFDAVVVDDGARESPVR